MWAIHESPLRILRQRVQRDGRPVPYKQIRLHFFRKVQVVVLLFAKKLCIMMMYTIERNRVKRMKRNQTISVGAVVFLIIGIVLIAVGIVMSMNTFNDAGREETTATIIHIETYSTGRNRHRNTYVRYEVDGQMLEGKLGSYSSSYFVGKEIDILYDINDPSQITAKGTRFIVLLMPFMGLVFGCVGAWPLFSPRIKRRRKDALRETGITIHASYMGTEENRSFAVNGRHPYRITCRWRDPEDGTEQIFRSENLWQDPSDRIESRHITTFTVYMDPNKKKRYVMDLDPIMEEVHS